MSGGNSQFCAGDYAGCLEACELTLMAFRELGCVVGNPFFHLRAGQASFELDEGGSHDPAGTSIDNLARALICGGVEIFNKEDDKYLDSVLEVLEPPQGYSSWREATGQGCSVDLLNGATGFLVDSLIEKYGSTPPYN